jgi:hypothetical protein
MTRHILICCVVVFVSCMNAIVTTPVLIDPAQPPLAAPPASWTRYGAYYLYDELFVESSYYSSSWRSSPVNRIIYNKKLRILSNEGVAHGNIEIPVYSAGLKSFKVTLTDADGHVLPLNSAKLKDEFLRKGVIVVPNVTAGCEITAYVEYETYHPITYYEYGFSRSIPALVNKYTFSALESLDYDFKGYNLDVQPRIELRHGRNNRYTYRYHIYELRNVVPRPQLEFEAYADSFEKWVAIVLRHAKQRSVFTEWSGLASDYEKVYFPVSLPSANGKAALLVDAVKKTKTDSFAIADSLLQWVQEHIIQDESAINEINFSKVLETQKGNIWEITALVRQLFTIAGFTTDIVVTRSKEMGGFDKDFVAPMVLVVPLVVVSIDSVEYVAFPFRRGGMLGEYPEIFNGIYGLSLSHAKPVALPLSTSTRSRSASRFTVDCRKEQPELRAAIRLYGGFAFDTRTFLRTVEIKKHREFVQKWLTELGTSNALEQCTINGTLTPGAPLTIEATFSNPNQVIEKDNMMHIKLSNIFDKYYESYDTLREEDFVTVRTVDDTETVCILAAGAKVAPSFECRECANRLFTVDCSETASGDTTFLRRITHIDSVSIGKEEMKRIYPDILANNRISESSIAITRVPAAAKKHPKKR